MHLNQLVTISEHYCWGRNLKISMIKTACGSGPPTPTHELNSNPGCKMSHMHVGVDVYARTQHLTYPFEFLTLLCAREHQK